MQIEPTFITEGSAQIIRTDHVFYNPVQHFNRDLSVLVISEFSKIYLEELENKRKIAINKEHIRKNKDGHNSSNAKVGLRILEALSATGLRSIRYAKEVPGISEIIANDLSKSAVESIEQNIIHNNVEHIVKANVADATYLMYVSIAPDKLFDVIDLDPYGCPNRFLDGAIQCITDGGLLLVTATDMAVLAGNTPEACFVKYGSVSLKMKACHEMALRILLKCIEGHANRYGKYIEPLLSISADFYIRIFVRVFTSQLKCKNSMSKQSMVYQCTGCETFTLQPLGTTKAHGTKDKPNQIKFCIPTGPPVNTECEHCKKKHHMGGPIWSAPIHNMDFVNSLLESIDKEPYRNMATQKRILGVLSVVAEELDVPLYYSLDKMCSVLRLEIIPMLKFRSALLHAGYNVSFSHAYKNSIKTDAPSIVLWDILRCWSKLHPVKAERLIDGTPTDTILKKDPQTMYNLQEMHPLANPKSRKKSLVRFPENPTPHWGPGTRATLMIGEQKMIKSYRNQNKKKKKKCELQEQDEQMKKPKIDID